jgi:threonine/homoserine/homoserine lactone efflux protein
MSPEPQRDAASQGWDPTSWLVGCAVGAAATTGIVIFVFLVALALQPPTWVQIVLGGLLALGGAIFAWLIASAWRSREQASGRTGDT